MSNYGPPPGYGPPQQGPGYPPPAPHKSVFSGVLLALIVFFVVLPICAVVGCVVCVGVSRGVHDAERHAPAAPATIAEPGLPPEPVADDPPGSFRDGTHVVGSEVQPGIYRATGTAGCYWARLGGFSGEIGDLLANDNGSGPVVVTIGKSDKGFESRRCGLWVPTLEAVTESQTADFGDGTFIVGTDIAPGTWRAASGAGCYWARLRGFSGQMGDLITNANGKSIVTIAATDKGFKSKRCGGWSRAN